MRHLNFVGFLDIFPSTKYDKAFLKWDSLLLQSASSITNCDRLLLQSEPGIAKRDRRYLSEFGIIKCDNSYKERRNT